MGKVIRVRNLEIGSGRPKICAIVLGETEREILDLAERSNTANCDMIEFRADHYAKILDLDAARTILGKIRKICRNPIIFTFRRKEEGGRRAEKGRRGRAQEGPRRASHDAPGSGPDRRRDGRGKRARSS